MIKYVLQYCGDRTQYNGLYIIHKKYCGGDFYGWTGNRSEALQFDHYTQAKTWLIAEGYKQDIMVVPIKINDYVDDYDRAMEIVK